MNKPTLLLVLGLSALNTASAAESAENLASGFSGLPVSEQTMANLPKGREQEVLAALVKRQSVYPETLLRINHEPTVKSFFESYIALEGRSVGKQRIIADCGSPYIIDELAPLLYSTDQIFPRAWGEHADTDWGAAAGTALLIGKIIQKAPEFSPELKAWAKETLNASIGEPPRPDIIQAARAWWELNQDALLANQFDQVEVPAAYPLAPLSPSPVPPAPNHVDAPPPAAPAASPASAPALDPERASPSPPSLAVAAPPTPSPSKPTNSFWWLLAALAALAVAFLAIRNKNPKP